MRHRVAPDITFRSDVMTEGDDSSAAASGVASASRTGSRGVKVQGKVRSLGSLPTLIIQRGYSARSPLIIHCRNSWTDASVRQGSGKVAGAPKPKFRLRSDPRLCLRNSGMLTHRMASHTASAPSKAGSVCADNTAQELCGGDQMILVKNCEFALMYARTREDK